MTVTTSARPANAPARGRRGKPMRKGVGPVADRLAALAELAQKDPGKAQADAWRWIQQLGATRDRRTLDSLFELGSPPAGLDGPADGILVTTLINPLVDVPVQLLTRMWMPWKGKVFDAAARTGINRVTPSAELAGRVLWPLYRMRDGDGEKTAFEFVSGAEPGKIEPRVPVLKIDYRPVSRNPRLVIRDIRDELVEIVDNTYLGRILFRLPLGRYTNIGYFALRQPATT